MLKHKNYLLINTLLLGKIILNIIILYFLIDFKPPLSDKLEHLYLYYIKLFILFFIILSVFFNILLLNKFYKKYWSYLLLDIYTIILLIIFFVENDLTNTMFLTLVFPFSLMPIFIAAGDSNNLSIFNFYGIIIFIILMWIYSFIFVPIGFYKFIKKIIYENILKK